MSLTQTHLARGAFIVVVSGAVTAAIVVVSGAVETVVNVFNVAVLTAALAAVLTFDVLSVAVGSGSATARLIGAAGSKRPS